MKKSITSREYLATFSANSEGLPPVEIPEWKTAITAFIAVSAITVIINIAWPSTFLLLFSIIIVGFAGVNLGRNWASRKQWLKYEPYPLTLPYTAMGTLIISIVTNKTIFTISLIIIILISYLLYTISKYIPNFTSRIDAREHALYNQKHYLLDKMVTLIKYAGPITLPILAYLLNIYEGITAVILSTLIILTIISIIFHYLFPITIINTTSPKNIILSQITQIITIIFYMIATFFVGVAVNFDMESLIILFLFNTLCLPQLLTTTAALLYIQKPQKVKFVDLPETKPKTIPSRGACWPNETLINQNEEIVTAYNQYYTLDIDSLYVRLTNLYITTRENETWKKHVKQLLYATNTREKLNTPGVVIEETVEAMSELYQKEEYTLGLMLAGSEAGRMLILKHGAIHLQNMFGLNWGYHKPGEKTYQQAVAYYKIKQINNLLEEEKEQLEYSFFNNGNIESGFQLGVAYELLNMPMWLVNKIYLKAAKAGSIEAKLRLGICEKLAAENNAEAMGMLNLYDYTNNDTWLHTAIAVAPERNY